MAPMAPGVSAEEMHLRVPFPGRQMSAIADAPGPHILLEAGGLLLTLLSFCAVSGGSKGCAHRTKSSEVV